MVAPTIGWIRPKVPPRTITRGLSRLTRSASPTPSQRPARSRLASAAGPPARGVGDERVDRLGGRHRRQAPPRSRASSPTSSSQQPTEPHRHAPPAGLIGRVTDLAREAGDARQRVPVDDDPAADADLARDEDHVVGAPAGTATQLRQRTEVGIVGDVDRQVQAERLADERAERDVAASRGSGRWRPRPSVRADHARDRDADADEGIAGEAEQLELRGELAQVLEDVLERRSVPRGGQPPMLEDLAAEAHDRGRRRVDGDLEGEDHRRLRHGSHDR